MIRGSWASFRPQGTASRPSTLLRPQHGPSSAPRLRRDALPSPLHLPPNPPPPPRHRISLLLMCAKIRKRGFPWD